MEEFWSLFDYQTLWFLVVGALFSGYAILDGFDFGAGCWHLYFKEEKQRRIALNAIGPVWDGNEVWLVIGGGALFAGFPVFYASLFSALYIPLMLFLMFIILRAISIEFRSKEEMLWWRKSWDVLYSISSFMLAFLLGVLLGNILQGIQLNQNLEYSGTSVLEFISPFSVLVGITTVSLFMVHGGIYLLMKTEDLMYLRLRSALGKVMGVFMLVFLLTTLYALLYIPHLSDDLKSNPALFVLPSLSFLSILNIPRLISKKKYRFAFLFSALTLSFLMMLVALEIYPNLLFNSQDLNRNITIYNAASSEKSIGIMLKFVLIGGPLVLFYTLFVYHTFKGKVKLDENSY